MYGCLRAAWLLLLLLGCRLLLVGQLIHSKKTMGHGKCTTAEEVQKIIDHVQEVIDSK